MAGRLTISTLSKYHNYIDKVLAHLNLTTFNKDLGSQFTIPTLSQIEKNDNKQTPNLVCCSFSKQDSKSVITRDLSGYAGPSFGTDDIDIAIHLKLSSLTRQEAGHFVCRVKTHLVVLEMLLSTDPCQNM